MCEEAIIEFNSGHETRILIYVYCKQCQGETTYIRNIKRATIDTQKSFIKEFDDLSDLAKGVAHVVVSMLKKQPEDTDEDISIVFSVGQPNGITCSRNKPPTRYLALDEQDKNTFFFLFEQNYQIFLK